VLLHRYLDAGPETGGQGANGDANLDSDLYRITFGHGYHGHEGTYENTAADTYAVDSADVHTHVQPSAYRHANAHCHADDHTYGDIYLHPDPHPYAYAYADRNAYRDTRPDGDAN